MQELLTMLDTKYKRLEYIQSTGTQWIDTGYTPNYQTKIDIKFGDISAAWICGSKKSSSSAVNFGISYHNACFGTSVIGFSDLSSGKHIINYGQTLVVDGTTIGTFPETTETTTVSLALFGIKNENNSVTGLINGKIYYCQIYDNNQLVRNFVPVLRKSDNEIGMLDLVEGKFYGNAGTGKFTANLDTMYALIQGTPTVQDGRVSNFSSSNYLTTSEKIYSSRFNKLEIKIKFITNTNNQGQNLCAPNWGNGSCGIYINSLNVIAGTLYYNNGNTNTYAYFRHTEQLEINKIYFGKIIYDFQNKIIEIGLSEDDKIYNTVSLSFPEDYVSLVFLDRQFQIGNISQQSYLHGTIDLNRSYIKIDDTKYKLQAVVGYTIVGSPTITDGVVSGFSSSDYLTLSSNLLQTNDLEISTKISTTIGNYQRPICYGNFGGLAIQTSGKAVASLLDVNGNYTAVISDTILQSNTYYTVKFRLNAGKLYIEIYSDEGTLIESKSISTNAVSASQSVRIGNRPTGGDSFAGSIDLNQTYIRINNKLWFNGLPNN